MQASFLRDNSLINDNVMHTSYEKGVEKLISCLSTCVYPDKVEYPLDETKIHLGLPHESNFGYAHAKRMVDVANQYGRLPIELDGTHRDPVHTRTSTAATSRPQSLPTSSAPTTTCALASIMTSPRRVLIKRTYSDLEDAHVIPALIHKCYLAKSTLLRLRASRMI